MSGYLIDGKYYDIDIPTNNPKIVKLAIATNSKSKNLLSLLCDDEFIGTLGIPFSNPNIDSEDIKRYYKKFKKNATYNALYNISCNINTPEDILEDLYKYAMANDYIEYIKNLAKNPKTPQEVLEKIADYEIEHETNNHYVLCKAIVDNHRSFHISLHSKLLDKALADANLAIALIKNEYCIYNSIEALYKHKNANVRYTVAKSEYCSREVLLTLAEDSSIKVKRAVAANPSSCAVVLDKLIDTADDGETLFNILMNPNCVEPLYKKILKIIE